MELLVNVTGKLITNDMEKAKVLSALFTLIFTSKPSLEVSQILETRAKVWNKEDLPLWEEDWVREHLNKLDVYKSMWHDGLHPQVLRDLTDVIFFKF